MGAGAPANTGVAGASHRVGFFAGTPAPTPTASRLRIEFSARQRNS
ncbi:diguanylate cyclase [Pseudomonas sp. CAH-1]|nr:diguanylate cyclase [Pseudomonas sp. CAH-1]